MRFSNPITDSDYVSIGGPAAWNRSPTVRFPQGVHGQSRLGARTDLSALAGMRVLCVVDDDNLRISMKAFNARLSYRKLLEGLEETASCVWPWAVLTAPRNDRGREAYFRDRGWDALTIWHEIVPSVNGPKKKANADLDLCFQAGCLVASNECDAVLIGSGDGDLCVSVARGIKRRHTATLVYTLSIPGSTSVQLSWRKDLFDGNIFVGLDMTRRIGVSVVSG